MQHRALAVLSNSPNNSESVIIRAAEEEAAAGAAQLAAHLLQFGRAIWAYAHDLPSGLPWLLRARAGTPLPGLVRAWLADGFGHFFRSRSAAYLAIRRFISSGATSSTWVAMVHMCPKGSYKVPLRSP